MDSSSITEVSINNVQSIKHLELKLGDITVFTGPTDSGKSAVLEAVNALFTNTYFSELLRHGERDLQVEVEVAGHKIGFNKGSKSFYYLDDKQFSEVGKEVPKEIRDILKLEKSSFDKDISYFLPIQTQFQPQFLVNEFGGVSSKVIGKLSNLAIIYIATRRAQSEVKDLKQAQTRIEAEREGLRNEAAEVEESKIKVILGPIQEAINTITGLESRLQDHKAIIEAIEILSYENSLRAQLKDNNLMEQVEKNLKLFEDSLKEISAIEEAIAAINLLSKLKSDSKSLEVEVSEVKQILSDIKICPTCGTPVEGGLCDC